MTPYCQVVPRSRVGWEFLPTLCSLTRSDSPQKRHILKRNSSAQDHFRSLGDPFEKLQDSRIGLRLLLTVALGRWFSWLEKGAARAPKRAVLLWPGKGEMPIPTLVVAPRKIGTPMDAP